MYQLSDQEFDILRTKVYGAIGVNLTSVKKTLTLSRLSKRLKELNITGFTQYIKYLEDNPEELEHLFNLITTNVTKFFREEHHFVYLEEVYLPWLEEQIQKNGQPKEIRVWSAGCSTGEEPYTLAMVLDNYFEGKGWNIKILASDINTQTLEKAQLGVYSQKEIEGIPYGYLSKYFQLGVGANKGNFRAKERLRKLITFKQINLTEAEKYPLRQGLGIIFCRNVFIYFDKPTQEKVLAGFAQYLAPKGLLCLGHSESISNRNGARWRLIRHTVYELMA